MKPLALAFILAALLSLIGVCAGAEPAGAPLGALWETYKQRFISADGRLVDDFGGGVSHSEGQGYAMWLAQFAGDRETFDRLWAWTQANLRIRPDGLSAWRWRAEDNPHAHDKNNATDGDLLIAWALAEAGRRWQEPRFDAAAAAIVHTLFSKLVYKSLIGPTIPPGAAGFGPNDGDDGPVVNLSYWVFPAFGPLQRVAPDVDWAGLRRSGLALLDAAKFGPRRLPSDWISLRRGIRPADAYPNRFGFEVVRVPLYLAWGEPQERARLATLVDAWAGAEDAAPPVIDNEAGAILYAFAEPGYRAVAALARCVAYDTPFPADLGQVDFGKYYPATLQMLALAALRDLRAKC